MKTRAKQTVHRLVAVLSLAIAFSTGDAWATDKTWNGGTGGTEAAPLDIYDEDCWNPSGLPTTLDRLIFATTASTVVTNGLADGATTQISGDWYLKSGDWTFLGPAKFASLENPANSGTVAITKKGDWTLSGGVFLGRKNNTVNFTNVSGNLALSTTGWLQFGNDSGGKAVVENLSGDWTLAGKLSIPHGANSIGELYWRGGNLECTNTGYPVAAVGANTTSRIEKDGGDWTLKVFSLGNGAESDVTFIHRGGSMNVSGNLVASSGSNSVVTIEKDAGDWTLANLKLGQGGKNVYSEAMTTFNHNGGSTSVSGQLDMTYFGSCDFFMNGGTVTVEGDARFGTWILKNGWHHAAIHLAGGVFAAESFYLHNSDNAQLSKVVFDGGTFRAKASGYMVRGDNSRYNPEDTTLLGNLRNRFGVEVGPLGGTIDTAGQVITNVVNFTRTSGSGGMRFVGGGSVVLTGTIGYTGKTSVEVGTILEVTDASAKNTILNTRGLDIVGFAEAGDYTVFTYEDGLDASTDLANVTCSFAPDSTFEVVGNSIVCHYVPQTIEGAYWTGAANDGNLSTAGNWSGNQVPMSGNVTIALAAPATFAVGDTFRADTITIPDSSSVVTIGEGDLHLSGSLTNANQLAIAQGAALTVDGDLVVCNAKGTFLHSNEGTVTIAGNAVCKSGTTAKQYDVITANTEPIKVGGFLLDRTGDRAYFRLDSNSADGTTPGKWVVGGNGFQFLNPDGEKQTRFYIQHNQVTLYSSADWTLQNTGLDGTTWGDLQLTADSDTSLKIDTSDYSDSTVKRTVTLEGRILAAADVTIAGCGTVIVATTAHNGLSDTTIASGKTLAVTDTATLQVNAGKKIAGDGTISLAAGTTLKLMTGTDRQIPTFANLSLALPAEGKATLSIDGDKPLRGDDYVLFGNVPAGYADHLDVTGTAIAGRRATLKADDGNLILSIPKEGLSIILY